MIPSDRTETARQLRDLLGAGEEPKRNLYLNPKAKGIHADYNKAVAAEGAGQQAKSDMFYKICAAISTPNPEKSSVDSARPISSVPNVNLTVAMKLPVQTQQVPK
ncbi:hypothetical protein PSTG_10967 [Puccinia striiformis f. sp. tritici PST-78]|uniref:Uncharacterized protein n=1 Tax=Puccinia striiformis f. sp. tritici PST-78 TaxID=1165861 RepID=A0A0L0V978_9BASI|nr:hypothetical protein PSTG_10967 [Puccinia striiformis f. sp. tritici PST-78]